MAVACRGLDSQDLATILDPFRAIFADVGPDRQMSAVESGQMSAVPESSGLPSACGASKVAPAGV